jgi:predicted transposase/invertase (TIGR01784 family)
MDSQAKIKYIRMIDRERDLRNQFQFATDKGIAEGIEIGREEGRAEGFAEGMENGRAEGVSNVARKLKADGMDIDLIIKYSGLTREEIEKL